MADKDNLSFLPVPATTRGAIEWLFKRDMSAWWLTLGMLGILLGYLFYLGPWVFLLALLAFVGFDVIGWDRLASPWEREDPQRYYYAARPGYRLMQLSFQGALCGLCYGIGGYPAVIAFIVSWWFGLADALYYVAMRQYQWLTTPDPMPWLWWTPLGLLKVKMNGRALVISSLLGFALALSSCLWLGSFLLKLGITK